MVESLDESLWDGVLHSEIGGTFMGRPFVPPDETALRAAGARAAIYGIPWEASTSRSGASYGPRGIRDVSWHFSSYNPMLEFDVGRDAGLVDCGNTDVVPGNAARTFENAQRDISQIIASGALPITFGGDHSVTIPSARAIREHYDRPGLIFVDAHLDSAPDVKGETLNHACPVARAVDAGFPPEHVVFVAISGWGVPPREINYARDRGMTVVWIDDIWRDGVESTVDRALTIAAQGTDGIHLSVDIDSLDGSVAPGTGSPSSGGLTSREAIALVRGVAVRGLAGVDVAETAPTLDPTPSGTQTSLMAARIALEALASHSRRGSS